MQHTIPVDKLGPSGALMAGAVEKCVHCGFCLPTCPTYKVLREEMDSPRGRIILMKSVLEEEIELEQALPYIDRCLGCMACVTACPSGVAYNELLVPFREYSEEKREHSLVNKVARGLAFATIPHPRRFRVAAAAGKSAKWAGRFLPSQFQAMLALLPESVPGSDRLPPVYPAKGKRRARVALLTGCVQQVLAPEINWSTLRVLARNGVEVVVPKTQGCCGALSMHAGSAEEARQFARRNFGIFPGDVDAIITNSAGCGSGMREYPLLFQGYALEEQASIFSGKVKDISEFLDELGIEDPPPLSEPIKLAYHDACHLLHGQGISAQPRHILQKIPNLVLVPIPEGEICCGSAGTYNIEQPQIAQSLGERKVKNILKSGVEGVVMGNIGCMMQIGRSLEALGEQLPVWHTIEILDHAYQEAD
jgi:glycolate oxidase iron-sulfur subunit